MSSTIVPPTEESLIVIAVIPGLLVALILFPVLFLMSWWLCVCRTQRNRGTDPLTASCQLSLHFSSIVLNRTLSTKPFVPPMAKNPIYDGAETEIYEFIPMFTGLDSIDYQGHAPPNLPPPRRAIMDINIVNKHQPRHCLHSTSHLNQLRLALADSYRRILTKGFVDSVRFKTIEEKCSDN